MTGGQIAALVGAVVLLFPGGCFLFFGIQMQSAADSIASNIAPLLLIIAAVILSISALLGWIALRRRRPGPGDISDGRRS